MKGGSTAGGFTIVETLVVLAISGGMVLAIIFLVSGQQAKTQFQQAINTVSQQLQQTIDDVANGYYPTSNIQCSAGAGGPSITRGNSSLGTNDACVLVGKAIQFDTKPDPQQYIAYSMVGLRTNSAASPLAIATGTTSINSNVPGNSVKTSLANGLNLVYAYPTANLNFTEAFAVMSSNVFNSGGLTDISGSQQVSLYAVNLTKANSADTSNVDAIDNSSNYTPVSGFSICLASGTTNQSGLITVGGSNNRKLSVVLTIKDGKVC